MDLYVDIYGKQFVLGPDNPAVFTLPSLTQNDYQDFNVYLLARNVTYPTFKPFTIVNNAALSLKMAIGVKAGTGDGSNITNQFAWAKDAANQYFTAALPMNTAAIAAALGAAASISDRYLEIEYTQAGVPKTIYSKLCTIEADVIKNATLIVPAGQTPLSAETAANTYLPQQGNPGQCWVAVSPLGHFRRIIGIDDTGTRIDSIEAVP